MSKVATFHVIPGLIVYTRLPEKSRGFFIKNEIRAHRALVFSARTVTSRIQSMISDIFDRIRKLRNSDSSLHAGMQRRESVVSRVRTLW
jgi:hypothetical protein